MKITDKMQHNEASQGEKTCKKLGYHIMDRYKKELISRESKFRKKFTIFLKNFL